MESFDDLKYYTTSFAFERATQKSLRYTSPLKPRAPTPPRNLISMTRRHSSQSPKAARTQSVDFSPTSVFVFPVPYSFSVALSQTQTSPTIKYKRTKHMLKDYEGISSEGTFSPVPIRKKNLKRIIYRGRGRSLEKYDGKIIY